MKAKIMTVLQLHWFKWPIAMVAIVAAMLVVTSCMADEQAAWVSVIRTVGPTADFTALKTGHTDGEYDTALYALAEADAMVYFADHTDIKDTDVFPIGQSHAFRHHLIGDTAAIYTSRFAIALTTLNDNKNK